MTYPPRGNLDNPYPVWSKNSFSLPVSKKFKFFNEDELKEGTAWFG
jgi:hypothetical protein